MTGLRERPSITNTSQSQQILPQPQSGAQDSHAHPRPFTTTAIACEKAGHSTSNLRRSAVLWATETAVLDELHNRHLRFHHSLTSHRIEVDKGSRGPIYSAQQRGRQNLWVGDRIEQRGRDASGHTRALPEHKTCCPRSIQPHDYATERQLRGPTPAQASQSDCARRVLTVGWLMVRGLTRSAVPGEGRPSRVTTALPLITLSAPLTPRRFCVSLGPQPLSLGYFSLEWSLGLWSFDEVFSMAVSALCAEMGIFYRKVIGKSCNRQRLLGTDATRV